MSNVVVGIDWGASEMSVCALDANRKRLFERDVVRRGDKIEELVVQLLSLVEDDPSRLSVALEMPRAAIIEAFLARDVAVYSINPKQLDRFRDRHTVAGAKDDSLDAFVIADSLRTDSHLFRRVHAEAEQLVLLRERSRAYEDLTNEALALASKLRALLLRYYNEVLDLPGLHETPWIWRLIEVAPTPQRLRAGKTTTLVKRLEKKKTKLPADIHARLDRLREGKPLPVTRGTSKALHERVLRLLPLLRAVHRERKQCMHDLQQLVNELSADAEDEPTDMRILLSMPGIGYRIAAVLLAEASDAIARRDRESLRRLAGVAPVSRRSGGRQKTPVVSMRRANHKRISNAVHHWASIAIRYDPRARELYKHQRAKGHSFARALRTVGDRMLTVLFAALRDRVLYDPKQRVVALAA